MTKITYGISEEKYTLEGESRIAYGIVAYADVQINGTASIITSVCDITDDKNKLSAFVELCNKNELSPVHLYDAIEDFLTN